MDWLLLQLLGKVLRFGLQFDYVLESVPAVMFDFQHILGIHS